METPISVITTLFIVLLIVPGVFFKRFYFTGEFSKQFGVGLFADRLITSIFWGLIVQIITFLTFSRFFGFTLKEIKLYITNGYAKLAKNELPDDFDNYNLWMILGYLFASIVIAALLGIVCHSIIRAFKIDTKFRVFRFSNHWNYYFRGDILSSGDFKKQRKGKVLSTYIDVVMDGGNQKPKMFSGFLSQYTISARTGELEAIFLTDVKKYSESKQAFKEIPSDFLIIPYNKVIDLNIRYNTLKAEDNIKYKLLVKALFTTSFLLAFLYVLIFPWLLGLSFFRTLVGMIFLSWALIFFSALIQSSIKVLRAKPVDLPTKIAITCLFGFFLYLGLLVLKQSLCFSCLIDWVISKLPSKP
ncbi:hypothetical protein HNQ92_003180 [Rhabdobacter roseus]|uniref:Uncharacterized protein n=1 Tax=Rhabdobacter roseus TaxID=1655419 RepID=A0A840TTZ8_9BACT|nr:hypothetical protein [Rhabdobacter roseus]MBB5285032.1 hypothetical protein [Rhabdobacter roseus]